MNRYQSRTPRTAIGVAAIALTAGTMGITVLLPALTEAVPTTGIDRATVATATAGATVTQCINGIVAARS
ncbi:MAG TPA: hypothetical protein VFK60_03450 [Casimicrobiaceae bacterium]|nr:hypothetical protein [Casimicrobiaceae bacterium]